jgi:hypothetical protein
VEEKDALGLREWRKQAAGRKGEWAFGRKKGRDILSFDFVFLLFQSYFQNISKEFEFILNFRQNHSSQ